MLTVARPGPTAANSRLNTIRPRNGRVSGQNRPKMARTLSRGACSTSDVAPPTPSRSAGSVSDAPPDRGATGRYSCHKRTPPSRRPHPRASGGAVVYSKAQPQLDFFLSRWWWCLWCHLTVRPSLSSSSLSHLGFGASLQAFVGGAALKTHVVPFLTFRNLGERGPCRHLREVRSQSVHRSRDATRFHELVISPG